MTVRFKKGRHRARPLYWLCWWPFLFCPSRICRRVMFTHDSKYELPGGDQEDHNKLFGFSFGLTPHRNSARFGWRYDPGRNRFILTAYCYLNGKRIMEDLCECVANHAYRCELSINRTSMGKFYEFLVYTENGTLANPDTYMIRKKGQSLFGFLLGSYFGGNRPAPKNLSISLKKIS